MAVENEWGGRDCRRKLELLGSDIFSWFTQSREPLYIDDLQNMLDEVMISLNTMTEYDSVEEFKAEEITGIMKDFDERGYLAPTGLHLGGTKYMVIQGEQGAIIGRKKGSGGITIKKTGQALMFGIYEEPVTPGQCNMVVERLGDYLINQGL